MLGKLFARKRPAEPRTVIARLKDRLQPLDRGERYEDPLDAVLKERSLGEVSGGGTMLDANKEVEFCDIEISVVDASKEVLRTITETLEGLGAPVGSHLLIDGADTQVPFGRAEGLAIYLNGTDLPDSVYSECDSNFVFNEFNRLLDPSGSVHSHWQGPRETALYVYGRSAEEMKQRLAAFIASYPLCARARVEQIA